MLPWPGADAGACTRVGVDISGSASQPACVVPFREPWPGRARGLRAQGCEAYYSYTVQCPPRIAASTPRRHQHRTRPTPTSRPLDARSTPRPHRPRSSSTSTQFPGWGPSDRHNGLSYAKLRRPSCACMLRMSSQAVHSKCASRKDHCRRARCRAKGERRHSRQLQGGEPRLQREVGCNVAARRARVYNQAGETTSPSSCTSSPWVRGRTLARLNV